jgi:hypothetical protein
MAYGHPLGNPGAPSSWRHHRKVDRRHERQMRLQSTEQRPPQKQCSQTHKPRKRPITSLDWCLGERGNQLFLVILDGFYFLSIIQNPILEINKKYFGLSM